MFVGEFRCGVWWPVLLCGVPCGVWWWLPLWCCVCWVCTACGWWLRCLPPVWCRCGVLRGGLVPHCGHGCGLGASAWAGGCVPFWVVAGGVWPCFSLLWDVDGGVAGLAGLGSVVAAVAWAWAGTSGLGLPAVAPRGCYAVPMRGGGCVPGCGCSLPLFWGWLVLSVPANSWLGALWAGGRRVVIFRLSLGGGGWVLLPVFPGRGMVSVLLAGCVGGGRSFVGGDMWAALWCLGRRGFGGLPVQLWVSLADRWCGPLMAVGCYVVAFLWMPCSG